jgi:hypothetical protein
MYLIPQITDDTLQTQSLILPDGSSLSLTIYFIPMQYGWFITNLTYGTFVLEGVRITNNPNILQQFKNQLPFGLACFSKSDREPSQQQDFSSGASKLYILTSDEVEEYSEFLSNG